MAKAIAHKSLEQDGKNRIGERHTRVDWRRRMSDHVAYALLAYTGLQIFVTVNALKEGSSTILPYIALVVLVAGIIPACRWFERRWTQLNDDEAHDPSRRPAFRRDVLGLWAMAILVPIVMTAMLKALFAVT